MVPKVRNFCINAIFVGFRTLLRSVEIQRNPKRYLQVVQKVIAYMTLGVDVSKLFSEMIMVSQARYYTQKCMCLLYYVPIIICPSMQGLN